MRLVHVSALIAVLAVFCMAASYSAAQAPVENCQYFRETKRFVCDEFLEYSALRGGHRVDYVRSPLYTFADGRGVATDFGDIRAKEAVIALHRRNGERHELATRMGP